MPIRNGEIPPFMITWGISLGANDGSIIRVDGGRPSMNCSKSGKRFGLTKKGIVFVTSEPKVL